LIIDLRPGYSPEAAGAFPWKIGAAISFTFVALALAAGIGLYFAGRNPQNSTTLRVAKPAGAAPANEPDVPAGMEQPAPLPREEEWPGRTFPIKVKRRKQTTEDELYAQLRKVPEVTLDPDGKLVKHLQKGSLRGLRRRGAPPPADEKEEALDVLVQRLRKRPDLAGLPRRPAWDCSLDKETAKELKTITMAVREELEIARHSPKAAEKALKNALLSYKGPSSQAAVAALQQMLMVEAKTLRLLLIDCLAQIKGKQASIALARRALFDLHPKIREAALAALKDRPPAEYRDTLLRGLTYPWAPVADHAAEALVALRRKETLPQLVRLLANQETFGPFAQERAGKRRWVTPELVRINHFRNCLLCHPASLSRSDPVRGAVPIPGERIRRGGYSRRNPFGTFVRADVTYLRQDFSVPQTVGNRDPNKKRADDDPWPAVQRFDFLVQVRPLTRAETADLGKRSGKLQPGAEQRRAILFALRELTGKDFGPSAARWKQFLRARNRKR
jgi:hypothetical protein